MQPRLFRAIEAVVGLLIPCAHREHVLGDLHERYTGPVRYIVDAVRTVPLVILSQIARTTAPGLLLIEACAVYGSFLGVAWSQDTSFLYEQSGFLRLAIPAVAGLVALVVADAYVSPRTERHLRSILGAIFCVAGALMSHRALLFACPDLVTPRLILTLGGLISLALLSMLRRRFLPGADRLRPASAGGGSMTDIDIRRKVQAFDTRIRRRNRREYIAAGVVIAVLGWQLLSSANPVANLGGGLIIAGVISVVYALRKRGSPRTLDADAAFVNCVAFYRTELERQRDLLRGVWSWYIGPLIPGMVVVFWKLGATSEHSAQFLVVSSAVVMLVSMEVGKLNKRAASKLQREIDELLAMEGQNELEGHS